LKPLLKFQRSRQIWRVSTNNSMNTQRKNTLIVILALIAVIFAVLYFRKTSAPSFQNTSMDSQKVLVDTKSAQKENVITVTSEDKKTSITIKSAVEIPSGVSLTLSNAKRELNMGESPIKEQVTASGLKYYTNGYGDSCGGTEYDSFYNADKNIWLIVSISTCAPEFGYDEPYPQEIEQAKIKENQRLENFRQFINTLEFIN
jgi:hypothetical protein